jgi:hypothetical protein
LVERLQDATQPVEEPFRLAIKGGAAGRVYCLAMPQILERFPFSQGLPNCNELTEVVVTDFLGSGEE